MATKIFSDANGTIRLYDGTVVYVIEVQYSEDKSKWESRYYDTTHEYENDNTISIGPHKWMRIRHAGDVNFQEPWRINAEDGKSPELRISGDYIQWGYSDDADSWQNLIDTTTLKGEKGDTGPEGKGIAVNASSWYGEFINKFPTDSCTTGCNTSSTPSTGSFLVLSLGDGNHIITSADQTGGKYRSDTGETGTWLPIGVNDVGRTTRFIADDVNGTNYIDYRKTNTEYNSKGKVYAYADSMWTEMDGLTASNYLVAPSSAKLTEGKFMEDYASTTIGLDTNDDLEVKDASIGVAKFAANIFGHGLTLGTDLDVTPSEFIGKGIKVYTATSDSEQHIQIDVAAVASNGLALDPINAVDGSAAEEFKVNVQDLYNSTSGLTHTTEADTYDDLKVKAGYATSVDVNGVNTVADETSLTVLTDTTKVQVYPTDNNTKGIQALHLHYNTVNANKGLQKGNGTQTDVLSALEVKVDDSAIAFNNNGQLEIKDDGVQGVHLNTDTCNTAAGIEVDSDKLKVKIESGGGLEFNGSGEIKVSDSDILTDNVVKSLNSKVNDVTLTSDNTGATNSGITLSVNNSGAGIVAELATDLNTMKSYLGITSGTYAPLVHTHAISDVTGLQTALDTKLTLGTTYSNARIDATNGLQLYHSGSGKWFKLIVINQNGDLDTEVVT